MLYLSLALPLLPLEIFARQTPVDSPLIILEKQRVLCCNKTAMQQGIKPGISLGTATALSAQSRFIERSPQQEQQALQQLGVLCYGFSPTVVLQHNNSLCLDLTGCLKLHNGLQSLQHQLAQCLQDLGYSYRLGLADTPKAATLLSQCRHSAISTIGKHFPQFDYQTQHIDTPGLNRLLAKQPLSHLDCDAKLKNKWHKLGFSQLEHLLRLPARAIGRRFGKDFLRYLQQLRGEYPDPQQGIAMPEDFISEQVFIDGIQQTEQLLFPARRMLDELSHYLTARQLWCHGFQWQLQTHQQAASPCHKLHIQLTQAQNSAVHFLLLTRLKFEGLYLNDAVQSLRLRAEHFSPACQQSKALFADIGINTADDDEIQQLLDKLRTRLGEQAILQCQARDEHLPERACQLVPLQSPSPNDTNTSSKQRPLWLFPQAMSLHKRHNTLYWQGQLQLLQGPERIDSCWWQEKTARDYYVARHENGGIYWIYHDLSCQRWYVQGLFA